MKKLLFFCLLCLFVIAPVLARLTRVQREDRDSLALCIALRPARNGDTTLLTQALDRGAPANSRIYDYLWHGQGGIWREQLQRCVTPCDYWTTPLWRAAIDGNLPAVRVLLAHGADPRAGMSDSAPWASSSGIVAEMYSMAGRPASDGSDWDRQRLLPIARLLVSHGADIDRTDECGTSALDSAVMNCDATAIQALGALGAQATPETYDLLMDPECAQNLPRFRAAVLALAKCGPRDPNLLYRRCTLVQYALNHDSGFAPAADLAEVGFAPDAAAVPQSAIAIALHHHDAAVVPLLIRQGANVDAYSTQYRQRPLEAAIQTGNWKIAALLRLHDAAGSPSASASGEGNCRPRTHP